MPKGKWAQGITPRNFHWVISDRLAVCERPGGYGESHRKVRRQEEIIWIREQGFHHVVSLSASPHNLHNYDELGVAWVHRPFPRHDDQPRFLQAVYQDLKAHIEAGHKVLFHQEEVSDSLVGLMAGYVVWAGLIAETHKATAVTEQIVGRRLGPRGRELVGIAVSLRDNPLPPRPTTVDSDDAAGEDAAAAIEGAPAEDAPAETDEG
ncbi:MAG: hypothetical protein R2754_17895 [Microthrixaceae bacterium]